MQNIIGVFTICNCLSLLVNDIEGDNIVYSFSDKPDVLFNAEILYDMGESEQEDVRAYFKHENSKYYLDCIMRVAFH